MKIRKSELNDLPDILRIYSYAREFMKNIKNPQQWNDSYPPEELIIEDIKNRISHVIIEEEKICGVFVFFPDKDPIYDYIEDGEWLSDAPYGTIHRIASDGSAKGIVKQAVSYALNYCDNIRIDTHSDNKVMKHVLEKNGFRKCGIIYIENGEKRIGYQKI